MPELSIITINLNNSKGLERTLESVAEQKFKEFQHVVIDGASSDNSVSIIKKFERNNFFWISEKDHGIYQAMNKGVSRASGNYLLFLNSGDVFYSPTSLDALMAYAPKADLVACDLQQRNASGATILAKNPEELSALHLYESTLLHPATLIHHRLFKEFGSYDESYRIVGDYEFFVRVGLQEGVTYQYIPLLLSTFDLTGISSNEKHAKLHQEERIRVINQYFPKRIQVDLQSLYKIKNGAPYFFYQWIQKHIWLRYPVDLMIKLYTLFSKNKIA
ncbi:MAG: glycosyltransferase [Cytophagaceae bacterium]|jgi:glycosyltransferase involved in cell wall biosynthesis|nr:glycosyltransferase [Cytophagaceae bacterium]